MYTKLVCTKLTVVSSVTDGSLLIRRQHEQTALSELLATQPRRVLVQTFTTVFAMTPPAVSSPVYIGQLGVSGHATNRAVVGYRLRPPYRHRRVGTFALGMLGDPLRSEAHITGRASFWE